MTRASFTGAFDESCFYGVRNITKQFLVEGGMYHCFVKETSAVK